MEKHIMGAMNYYGLELVRDEHQELPMITAACSASACRAT